MKFRERLVLAASLTSLIGLGAGFGSVYAQVNAEHEREVDRVLGVKSREEADQIARAQVGAELPDDPDLEAAEIGHLHKYAVLYQPGGAIRLRVPPGRCQCAPVRCSTRTPSPPAPWDGFITKVL